jgi:uncharacterized protein YodC (DUF2158 family)
VTVSEIAPMNFTFRPRNVVRLKSGGSPMTVEGVYAEGNVEQVKCQWFSDGKFHDGVFEAQTLTRVEGKRSE